MSTLTEMLESRDIYRNEKELIEQNSKLKEELMKYRKAEQMLRAQGAVGGFRGNDKKRSVLESGELLNLINNLGVTKNNILKDLSETDGVRKVSVERRWVK